MKIYVEIMKDDNFFIGNPNIILKKGDIITINNDKVSLLNNEYLNFNVNTLYRIYLDVNTNYMYAKCFYISDIQEGIDTGSEYFTIYTEQYIREQKLNTLLDV